MSPISERPASLGFPSPGGHLDRLHANLLDLDERLGEAVAQAIGQAAAGVVRQVALSLLRQAEDGPTLLRLPPRPAGRSRPLWQTLDDAEERDRPPWLDEREEEDAFLQDLDRDRDADLGHAAASGRRSLWRQALAAALPALGWWLHRQAGRRAAGAALGCGLACGLALYLGGRKGAGTGLALTLLTESVGAVAALGARHQS
jgi:hypothetical protein